MRYMLLLVIALVVSGRTWAQSRSVSGADQNQQLRRGKAFYLQRCGLCHLGRERSVKFSGPSLSGWFGGTDQRNEAALRERILYGGPNMPGFRYGLDTQQIEDLIAYLKTL